MPVITEQFRTANFYEAGLWLAIGVVALGFALWNTGRSRRRCFLLAIVMFAFGPTDIVEAHTGAWWTPWWLLAWKGACVVARLILLVEHYVKRLLSRRQMSREQAPR